MPRAFQADELEQIEKAVRAHPGITSAEIADALGGQVSRRTLQFRLKRLVDDGRVLREGERRWARYRAYGTAPAPAPPEAAADDAAVPLSPESQDTILNLHAILANNLLADERAAGRLRHIGVGIDGSVYHPPETPQLVEECFDQLLATAAQIPSSSPSS